MRTLPRDLYDQEGNLIPGHKMTRDQSQAVAGIKRKSRTYETENGPVVEASLEYKLVDRQKAAEMIGRHHGIFEKDNKQRINLGEERLVAFPTEPMTLDQWQEQVQAVLGQPKQSAGSMKSPTSPPSSGTSSDRTDYGTLCRS